MIRGALSPTPTALLAGSMEQDAPASPLLALTTGLGRGSDDAWDQFHRDFGPGIFRQLLAETRGDHALATEALQQTYLRIARHARPSDFLPEFAAWLRVVTRSALRDCQRRQRSFLSLLRRRTADPTDLAGAEAPDGHLLASLDAALQLIGADERALLEAKYFHRRDVRSLAAAMDLTPKAVESRLTRARASLRRSLTALLHRHD